MKFAYLIMAHDNLNQLLLLIRLLDAYENDIYLHIDIKSSEIDINSFQDVTHCAKLHIYQIYDVKHAGISQTECQIFLLEEAIKEYHDYYHLLSGHDLPIKSNKEIADFFIKNRGKEFIHFESDDYCLKEWCRYYYFGYSDFAKLMIKIQRTLKINRKLYCGANWYSITHNLAVEFCGKKKYLIRLVKWTKSSDEYVLQTFYRKLAKGKYELYKTTQYAEDYAGTARLIDWNRGQPYVWRKEDYEEIINSDRLFARKFDENIDNEIIAMVVKNINERNKKIS